MRPATVYYNGGCPVCRTEIEHYKALARRSNAPLVWIDIKAHPTALEAWRIDADAATRRLHVAEEGGRRLLAGVDAFIAVWQRLPRYRRLASLAERRWAKPLAEALYEGIAAPALYRWNKWRGA